MLAVEDIFDYGKLGTDGRGGGFGVVTFERGDDFEGFVVATLADQEARRIWEEGAEAVDDKCEEDLEGEWKAPGDRTLGEAEAQCEPVGNTEVLN